MIYSDVKYPLRLCVELMHYCCLSNPLTEDKRLSDIKEALKVFFTDQEIEEASTLLSGETKQEPIRSFNTDRT